MQVHEIYDMLGMNFNGTDMTSEERPVVIVGNWKMYHTIDTSLDFLKKLIPLVSEAVCKVFLAVPFTSIGPMAEEAENTNVVIGAQNMHSAAEGAFTGEIAGRMLKEAGAQFVIVGHSERRRLFHEDNAFINAKVKRALTDGLQPILCIGETAEEHEEGKAAEVLKTQLTECLKDISPEKLGSMLIAYEPVWAIGTDQPATPESAQERHHLCREIIAEIGSKEAADKMCILYGGSVKPDNAKALLEQQDIDGLLVGGASLNADSFSKIVNQPQMPIEGVLDKGIENDV